MKVVITRQLPGSAIPMLKEKFQVWVWEKDQPIPRDILLEKVKDADGLLCLLNDKIDRGVIQTARKLKVISNYAAGFDNIDVAAASEKGIIVTNVPGVLTETTADLAFALLLAAARRIVEGDKICRQGSWNGWSPELLLGMDIWGKTLGIIGLGRIGRAVAKRARGFNMQIVYFSRTRKEDAEKELGVQYVPLQDLLRRSDFVVITASLTPESEGMIGEKELSIMKRTAILVNIGRGKIVKTEALTKALKEGWIWAAALDVTDPEPLPKDHPLLSLENVIITPHIGSATHQTREKMALIAAQNLLDALEGNRPRFVVNPEVL